MRRASLLFQWASKTSKHSNLQGLSAAEPAVLQPAGSGLLPGVGNWVAPVHLPSKAAVFSGAWTAPSVRGKTYQAGPGLKAYKPITPGFRGRVITSRQGLWKGSPYKPLTVGKHSSGGRNNGGSITSWHRGSGHKRKYRIIDFTHSTGRGPGVVERIEYDPNRSARIALVKYGGENEQAPSFAYNIAPARVAAGDVLDKGPAAAIRPGNTLPLFSIPIGQTVHGVEMNPGKGAQLARSAGASATVVARGADGYVIVRLPSGEQRRVLSRCTATIGEVSNGQHKNIKVGKAGANRWKGIRPSTRGIAMNPVDHPHGGGRGKRKGRLSVSPWGKPAKGGRTRRSPRTDQYIHLSRHKAGRRGRK
ncbi:hypothetical protein WJX74_008560 [Apatococcus lobatus]|uniref:Large ribosomal subunit protein uL2m n=1 Tax=Apatococcus lobatus TaxID=904363 RepID=A0AAW1Q9E6_9CHLO